MESFTDPTEATYTNTYLWDGVTDRSVPFRSVSGARQQTLLTKRLPDPGVTKMPLSLSHQTAAEFAARFWKRVIAAKQASNQVEYCRPLHWLTEKLIAGDITDAQARNSFNAAFGRSLDCRANGRRCVLRGLRRRMIDTPLALSEGIQDGDLFCGMVGNNGDGLARTNAKTTLAGAIALASANGDVIKVAHTHTGDNALAVDTTWTALNNISIVSVDKTNSDAPTAMGTAAWLDRRARRLR